MNRFVNPETGRLELPPDPAPTAAEKRRARWVNRFLLVFAIYGIATSTASFIFMSKPYLDLLRVAYVMELALGLAAAGIALWLISHKKTS